MQAPPPNVPQHAKEDPIDKIEGIETLAAAEAEALVARRIGAFNCTRCKEIFCEGIVCADNVIDGPVKKVKECPTCHSRRHIRPAWATDFSKCPEPLYKCDLCCSVAKYRCADYYQCEMHHSGAKTIIPCPGKDKCPLGVDHPQNAHVRRGFVIGCGCDNCK